MCHWVDYLDGQPGALPETRVLTDGTVLVIFHVSWASTSDARACLILRFDPKGVMYAGIQRESLQSGKQSNLL